MSDPSRTVRYYAALQMSGLDAEMGRLAAARPAPDPGAGEGRGPRRPREARAHALGPGGTQRGLHRDRDRPTTSPAPPRAGRPARRIGSTCASPRRAEPSRRFDQPSARAGGDGFKSLPDDVKADLRREGYDPETFWERLRQLGPSEIISIEGDEGERIQIWTEEWQEER